MAELRRQATRSRLSKAGSAVFDAAGRAEVVLGPVPPGQTWALQRFAISAGGTAMPTCKVYDGPGERPERIIDGTWTGTQDVSDFGTPHRLGEMDELYFVWTGGTPGAIAVASIVGELEAS